MAEHAVHNWGGRLNARNSLHPAVVYGVTKALGRCVEMSERQRMQYSGCNQFPTSITYSPSNGYQLEISRTLIDAYGTEKSLECPRSKPLLVEQMDRNCIDNKVWSTSWQNTEEEEFDWEDMKRTLIDHSRNNSLLPSTVGISRENPVVAANATLSEQDARKGWSSGSQLPPLNDSSAMVMKHNLGFSQPHDVRKISHHRFNSSQHIFNDKGQTRTLRNPPIDNMGKNYIKPYRVRNAVPRMVSGIAPNVKPPPSFDTTPSVNQNVTRPPTLNPIIIPPTVKHVVNNSSFVPAQSFDSVENKNASITQIHQFRKKLPGQISSNQQNRWQAPKPQFIPSQDPFTSQFSDGMSTLQGHGASISTAMLNPLPALQFPLPLQSIANYPLHPAHPPASSQMTIPHPNIGPFMPTQERPVGYTNLITSLMSQGVISLDKLLPAQNSIGTEFNADILKVRHESVVNGLYSDLPRQCSTCGLRFRSEEKHRSHMDWHVTKNRAPKMSKHRFCRQWFVSERMWLSGAEALGTDSVPNFSPTETKEEKKDDEELAVPAEEDQKTCALCEEPFDEFYSDETNDWMYRGATYLYQSTITLAAVDRSKLGPIIHAKCGLESEIPPSQPLGQEQKDDYEEGTQRKRMRI